MTNISQRHYWQTFLVLANSLHFFSSFLSSKDSLFIFFLLDFTNLCWDYRKIIITLALSSGLIRFTPKPYDFFYWDNTSRMQETKTMHDIIHINQVNLRCCFFLFNHRDSLQTFYLLTTIRGAWDRLDRISSTIFFKWENDFLFIKLIFSNDWNIWLSILE